MILVFRMAFVSERRIKYFLDLSVCTIIPTLRKEVKKNASKVRISGLWAMKGKSKQAENRTLFRLFRNLHPSNHTKIPPFSIFIFADPLAACYS